MRYEQCVLGADGVCTRWSHDHTVTLAEAWRRGAAAGHHSPLTWFALRQCNPYTRNHDSLDTETT